MPLYYYHCHIIPTPHHCDISRKEVEILSVGPVITIATSSFQLLTRIDASNIHVANNSFSVAFLDNFDSNVEISFTNSTFDGNSITTAVGSLINAPRGFSTLSLQACSFSHNEGASSVAKVKGTVSQLSILISQCSFRNNSIAGYDSQGAALHVDVSAQLNVTLDHSVFEYNSAGAAGMETLYVLFCFMFWCRILSIMISCHVVAAAQEPFTYAALTATIITWFIVTASIARTAQLAWNPL